MTPPFRLRPAFTEDAPALAALHVACWREAYADLLPPAVLAEVSVERRTFMWARALSGPHGRSAPHVFLALDDAGLAGFGACGLQRTPALAEAGFDGEVSALYVRACSQRRGLGTLLMQALARDLDARGCRAMALWVLARNAAARRFYDALGGAVVADREDRREHATLVEVAIGWPSLGPLIGAGCPS